MGTDIHVHVEVRRNNKWEYKMGLELDRNYDLFAMLADVRNGTGFAGIVTGEGFNPISKPKGLPKDVSAEVQERAEYWDGDAHSHSYLTTQELKEYDWNQKTKKRGVITLAEFKRIEGKGAPQSWFAAVSGPGTIYIQSPADKHLILHGFTGSVPQIADVRNLGKTIYVEHEWETTYGEATGSFVKETIPLLGLVGAPEDVRIVFYFDS